MQRYERLFGIDLKMRNSKLHQEVFKTNQELDESLRIKDERNGLAVLKKKIIELDHKELRDIPNGPPSNARELFGNDEIIQKKFKLTDLALYIRWIITEQQQARDLDLYIPKAETLLLCEKPAIIENYLSLAKATQGQDMHDSLYFEGVTNFIESIPNSPAKIEDFFAEFDSLVNFWKVETLIGQEDGRPFAYEVDRLFMDAVYEQCTELTMVPYDGLSTEVHAGEGIGGFPGNLGLDTSISSLATIAGISSRNLSKGFTG
jgi:hypothetical protein